MPTIIPIEVIANKIFLIRNQKIMLDTDLAEMYGVPTKALNQAVKRNSERFPDDFMFQLTEEERNQLVTNCDRFQKLKHSSVMPHAFTEQGVAMLSSVLNSEVAIKINLQIIRAFMRLRKMISENDTLRYAIQNLEKRVSKNERDIILAIKAIQNLIEPPAHPKPNRKIGFQPKE